MGAAQMIDIPRASDVAAAIGYALAVPAMVALMARLIVRVVVTWRR